MRRTTKHDALGLATWTKTLSVVVALGVAPTAFAEEPRGSDAPSTTRGIPASASPEGTKAPGPSSTTALAQPPAVPRRLATVLLSPGLSYPLFAFGLSAALEAIPWVQLEVDAGAFGMAAMALGGLGPRVQLWDERAADGSGESLQLSLVLSLGRTWSLWSSSSDVSRRLQLNAA